MPKDENVKKQLPLRVSPTLYAQLSRWAEEEFRSVNGQIEYLLTQAVKQHYGTEETKKEQ